MRSALCGRSPCHRRRPAQALAEHGAQAAVFSMSQRRQESPENSVVAVVPFRLQELGEEVQPQETWGKNLFFLGVCVGFSV